MARDPITAAGTKISIGGVAAASVDTATEFAALTWVDINLVENQGEFGDEAQAVPFISLGDARTQTLKGARSAGESALVVGDDPTDAGQLALIAAEATNFAYGFKVVTPNRLTPGGTDQIEYFRALVRSKRKNVGDANNVVRRTFTLSIVSAITNVAPT